MAGRQPTLNNAMLWATSTTIFFGFCRSGEVTAQCEPKFDLQTHLCFSDIAVDNALLPSIISIKLKYSKTDQFRKGMILYMERTNDNLCPVTALLSYLIHRGDAPGLLFQWDNHTPLSKSKFVNHVCHALLAANVPAHLYTGHSFHIRAATAAPAGIENSKIQTLGHWKCSAYLPYIRLYPLIWRICPPPWHSALFNYHQHLFVCTNYTYSRIAIHCLSGYKWLWL